MKIISWNVNGLKSSIDNGFIDFIKESSTDIVCIQEAKISSEMKNCQT